MPALRRSRRLRGLSPAHGGKAQELQSPPAPRRGRSAQGARFTPVEVIISKAPQKNGTSAHKPRESDLHLASGHTHRSRPPPIVRQRVRLSPKPISMSTGQGKSRSRVAAESTGTGVTRRKTPQRNLGLSASCSAAAAVPGEIGTLSRSLSPPNTAVSTDTPTGTKTPQGSDDCIWKKIQEIEEEIRKKQKMESHPIYVRSKYLQHIRPSILFIENGFLRLRQPDIPESVVSLTKHLDIGVGGVGRAGVASLCQRPRLFSLLQQRYTTIQETREMPELDDIRPSLQTTIHEIFQVASGFYTYPRECMRLLQKLLDSPLLHGSDLFPAGKLHPDFQTSKLQCMNIARSLLPEWSELSPILSGFVQNFMVHEFLTLNLSPRSSCYELFGSDLRRHNPESITSPNFSFGMGNPKAGVPVLIIDCPALPLQTSYEIARAPDHDPEGEVSENRLAVAAAAFLRSIDEHLFGGHAWPDRDIGDEVCIQGWHWPGIDWVHYPGPQASGYPEGIDEIEIRSKCLMVITVSFLNTKGRWGIVFVDRKGNVVMHNRAQVDWDLGTTSGVFEFVQWVGMVKVWLDTEWIPAMCTALQSRRIPGGSRRANT